MSLLLSAGAARRSTGLPPLEGFTPPTTPVTYPWGFGVVCNIPTPDGSGSTIHPSVVDMGGLWNGYRWWMLNTPYPNEDAQEENPCVYHSNDQVNWTVPSGLTNPIDPDPGMPSFHSDTELVWDQQGQRLVAYWRRADTSNLFYIELHAASSTDGSNWTMHGAIEDMIPPRLSPSTWQAGPGDWRMFRFSDAQAPATCMYQSSTPLGPWTLVGPLTIDGVAFRYWHGDFVKVDGTWLSIFTDKTTAYVATCLDDGLTWTLGRNVGGGATINTQYRTTMTESPVEGWMDVWCGGTAPVTGGRGTGFTRIPKSEWFDLL